ncbi:hypothetical protein EJ063_03450 [Vibrio aquaticus]|uniref:Porin n=1 Tax=Vibrio aquaticus TaxID=2496559 RepID=A0A432D1N5_9VIBR|nr:hypothetical protein [Vibrio aquaticus]RTZ17854.1 hypothetical protein EJ063_03450 [Vibrio aquaticus]
MKFDKNTFIPRATFAAIFATLVIAPQLKAEEVQDMSDPLAVYTQAGVGWTTKGVNIKLGQAYDTGDEDSMAQHVLELKGVGGELLGTSDQANDSVDSVRYRHFHVDTTNGRGNQVDVNWNFEQGVGTTSYSLIQALPKIGSVQLYPLAGLGLTIDESDSGYAVPASFALVGMYGKVDITDSIWLNYNPMYTSQLGGDEQYEDGYGLAHEAAVGYQITPRHNIRGFWNWGDSFNGTDFRVEMNIQF